MKNGNEYENADAALNAGAPAFWQRDRFEVFCRVTLSGSVKPQWRKLRFVKTLDEAKAEILKDEISSRELSGFIDQGLREYRIVRATGFCEVIQ